MESGFDRLHTDPENQIFKVVFYPDRVYHAQYLNATRSPRYRYNVQEVRSQADITVMKGEVFIDGLFLTNFLRVEYRASRLVEVAREKGRFVRGRVMGWIRLLPEAPLAPAETRVALHACRWTDSLQVEIWETLEAPAGSHHDASVLDLMGAQRDITRVRVFDDALRNIKGLRRLELAFRENDRDLPFGYTVSDSAAAWDNAYLRSHQEPRNPAPSSAENTVDDRSYLIDFRRGYFMRAGDVQPVRYRNAMMNDDDLERAEENVIEMRWLLQREFGGDLVFFHEVTIPPGKVEGTHRHIGTEELYYVVGGVGLAYLGENDDPGLAHLPTVVRSIYGLDSRPCKEVPVEAGSVIFTKSGGIHGIRNTGAEPLRFVAFLYHSS